MSESDSDKPICNICRQDDVPENLLTPCACRGTVGFVHFNCVKIWIETSGSDICGSCKQTYIGLNVIKKEGKFAIFFHQSEIGHMYSQFCFFFLAMFYLSYFGQFHCRLAYSLGFNVSAIIITIFNTFYLLVHVIVFNVYLAMIYLSFVHWRKDHFSIMVLQPNPVQKPKQNNGKLPI